MNGTRGLGSSVAGNAPRKGELLEEALHSGFVLADARIDLGVAALEIGVCHYGRTAVPGTGDEDCALIKLLDDPVHVRINEVEPGRSSPVTKQARFNLFDAERLPEQRVVEQINLTDGKIIGRSPVSINVL